MTPVNTSRRSRDRRPLAVYTPKAVPRAEPSAFFGKPTSASIATSGAESDITFGDRTDQARAALETAKLSSNS
jgi:hypothetical protein